MVAALSIREDSTDYKRILIDDVPLIDVRAPVEFAQGALPCSLNLPLMRDTEREAVGICYKQHGQEAAIAMGHTLICGSVREERIEAWLECCRRNPVGYLYCFRGGLRSHLVQQWLHEAGMDYPLVKGGYKAMRRYVLAVTETMSAYPMVLIGGNTGGEKTRLVRELPAALDLEGVARHRGSSFGRTLVAQSGQSDFENRLAITMLKKCERGIRHWFLEDEGRIIGSNHLPLPLYNQMQQAPIAVIDMPFEHRLHVLHREYIDLMRIEYERAYGCDEGWQRYSEYLHHGMFAIRRRLGLERYAQLNENLETALTQQRETGDSSGHLSWLAALLREYYDPMYSYQLGLKKERIVFRGSYEQVKAYLMTTSQYYGD